MNKDQTRVAIAVMQAWVDGEQIECRARGREVWHGGDCADWIWNWEEKEYRIKSRPMEIEVWVDEISGLRSLLPKDDLPKLTQWTKKLFREVYYDPPWPKTSTAGVSVRP